MVGAAELIRMDHYVLPETHWAVTCALASVEKPDDEKEGTAT
jgi:hypothetical protein